MHFRNKLFVSRKIADIQYLPTRKIKSTIAQTITKTVFSTLAGVYVYVSSLVCDLRLKLKLKLFLGRLKESTIKLCVIEMSF